MGVWERSLDAAGIREAGLRADYGAQRSVVARFRRASYVAARLLLPRPVVPHVVAATAVMHHGDNLLDTGTRAQRTAAWETWEGQVRRALESGVGDDPLMRTLVHTMDAHPRLRGVVEAYLSTAQAELEFDGFATEGDFQAYVDAYSLPGFMLVASLIGPEADGGRFRAGCRTFVEASQRLDFVNDLAEDLREGRLGVPMETLKRFSVTAEDLADGRESSGVRELVDDQVRAARAGLEASRDLSTVVPGPNRALVEALVEIELLTADSALRRGAELLRGSASPPPLGTLRVLARAYRRARGQR